MFYMWDVGFDYNSTITSPVGEDTFYLLMYGFVSYESDPRGRRADEKSTHLKERIDQVGFNLFNCTNPEGGPYVISNVSIYFEPNAPGQDALSPFNDPAGKYQQIIQLDVQCVPRGGSAVFGLNNQYQVWCLSRGITPVNPGNYEFTITLDVQGPQGTKRFRRDPEMIVGGATIP
jgi:hypothetical protein